MMEVRATGDVVRRGTMEDLQISAISRARLKGRLVVASLSGGKDSTALALPLKAGTSSREVA
jgi:tRNA(Ile)-lysidine synthase TilS/MesJ